MSSDGRVRAIFSGARLRRVLRWTLLAAVGVLLPLAAWVALPLPRALTAPDDAASVTLLDRSGLVLRTTRAEGGVRARWMPLGEMDPDLLRAFIATEDRRFLDHHGVDARALARAARDNLRAGRIVSGASTLTMQTARLLTQGRRSWGGKVAQALWAVRLEAHLSKQQILEQYLNRVHLGQGAVGVAAAARLYFGASARELSVGQAALLAGIARAPSRDNPISSPRAAAARRAVALARMRGAGFIGAEEVRRAAAEPLLGAGREPMFEAPHFTTRVLQWMRAGAAPRNGTVRTSLDLALQHALEDEVRRTVEDVRARGGRHAALVVLDNASGEILAWVGSPDFWSDTAGQTDMVVSPRQPGSALKPFLYGLAFDGGFTPATVLADVPRSYATATGPYRPRNYDQRFRGPVRAREALASSYNVPAVELAERVGVARFLETLHAAGFSSLDRSADHYGLGLALGNGDVTLLELANGYRALAGGGVWRPWRWSAADAAGHAPDGPARRVMSARAAALVLDILRDPVARIPGFGVETPFDFPFPVAVKTGTSRHFTDNWAVAATGRFTVAVWVGNFSGRPMDGVSGITGAGPLLHRAVLLAAARYAPGALATPADAGAVPAEICRLSGLLATPECDRMVEWFAPGTAPFRADDWQRGGRTTLPDEYAEWLATSEGAGRAAVMPDDTRGADGTAPATQPDDRFRIVSPQDGDRYRVPPGVEGRYATVALRAAGGRGAGTVRWYVDGARTDATRLTLLRGEHVVRALAPSGETAEVRIIVE
ncbi:MAG TPA: penicillin-binding protein 1C [Gemmatimonadaceae bacterium]|nr:penicillin-binding protein 1C [Gemmatimonadaceae bacterium]